MRTLVLGPLRVELKEPDDSDGSRFDRTAWVTSLRWEGRELLGGESGHAPWGAGTGLCWEFGIFTPVAAGPLVPKLGVGSLTVGDGPYSFLSPYPVEPARFSVTSTDRTVDYRCEGELPGGGYKLCRAVLLGEGTLQVVSSLENRSDHPLVTEEYGHNFLALGGAGILPGLTLRWSDPWPEAVAPFVAVTGDQGPLWRCAGTPGEAVYARSDSACTPGEAWTVSHPAGVTMRESVSFAPKFRALWGTAAVVSPEVFLGLTLPPGGSLQWSRTYTISVEELSWKTL